jgi:aminoglycoside phosphotransferase (APT) family kinase protein/8-oxo-dGTP pyrophosphatase MutT (NUDIX family)
VDEEVVALYDDGGRPTGAAPRSVVRAQNLRHGATGVIVRDPWGRVYVHRRTHTKDVYPSRWDFSAGGVLLAGEDPLVGARRELAEELGVTSEPVPLGEADYADEHTSYRAFLYVTTWDGPITPQPEEVAYGAWLSIERLLERIDDPEIEFMPDSVSLLVAWLRDRAASVAEPEQGWDSVATVVEGQWLDRRPRYPDFETQLRTETRLMARLAPLVPLPVPEPVLLEEEPLRVRHRMIPGSPASDDALDAEQGARLGEFLRCLHDLPVSVYVDAGVPDAVAARAELLATLERFLHRVQPLLPDHLRAQASELLRHAAFRTPTTLVHGDLGPRHVLCQDGRITGVIDWSDVREADPALDLAWPLYGAPEPFAEAVATAYGATDDELERALAWYGLAPWYDVLWGLGPGGQEVVDSGLAAIVERLT